MIRKVMVLATACLMANPPGAAAGALTACRLGGGAFGLGDRRTLEPNSGLKPRRSFGRYLGASTAAPPITTRDQRRFEQGDTRKHRQTCRHGCFHSVIPGLAKNIGAQSQQRARSQTKITSVQLAGTGVPAPAENALK